MRKYESKGIICIKGLFNLVYAVCKITYTITEDENYEYIFEPNYPVIDLLDSSVFQGIPGLNLDLRKKEYIRNNKVPTFISERVPTEKREDYFELLSKVNMEFMDPIEYLIRSKEQYSGDELFVKPYNDKSTILFEFKGNETNNTIIKHILENICLGNDIIINNQKIDDTNRKMFHDVFIEIYSRSYMLKQAAQKQGIINAKKRGVYKGRKPKAVDELKFREMLERVQKKQIKPKEAAKELNISIDKYYRFIKQLQK